MKDYTNNALKAKNKTSWQVLTLTLIAAFAVTAIPEMSQAAVSDVFSNTLCGIAKWFNGSTGKAIATVAVIFLGIAAFFGKVTWGLALMFAVGIFAIFGASEIVDSVSNDKSSGKNCT